MVFGQQGPGPGEGQREGAWPSLGLVVQKFPVLGKSIETDSQGPRHQLWERAKPLPSARGPVILCNVTAAFHDQAKFEGWSSHCWARVMSEDVPSPPPSDVESMSEAEIVAANSALGGQTGAEVFDQCCCQGGCLRSINENSLIKSRFKELQQSITEAPVDKKAEFRFEVVKDWLCDSQGDDWTHHRELKTLGGIRLCQSAASVILLCCKKTVRALISWIKEGNEHPKRDGRTCKISQESPEARTANLMLAWAPCLIFLHV